MDKGKIVRLLLIPILIGLVVTIVVRQVLATPPKSTAAQVEMATVVAVGKEPIPARTRVSDQQFVVKQVPRSILSGGELTSLKDVVGSITTTDLAPGEIVLQSRLVPEGKGTMPYRIPEGMRAVTIRMDELNGVAGYPEPGDLVDLVFFAPAKTPDRPQATSRMLYEGVLVLGKGPAPNTASGAPAQGQSGAKTSGPDSNKLTSLTLALTPQAAVEVALDEEIGQIKVLLRPALKESNAGKIIMSDALYR